MTFFSTSERLEIGEVPFISHTDKPTRQEALEYFRRVITRWELPINNYEEVIDLEQIEDHFKLRTNKSEYLAKKVVISTGFYGLPNKMNIPGENAPHVKHYYDDSHPYLGKKVCVIGAANSACDVALELYQKGVDVSMIVRGPSINDRVKYWIKPNIENRINEGSISAYFNAEPLEIGPDTITFKQSGENKTIDVDFVLAMTGYRPDYGLLEKFGVAFQEDDHRTPEYNEENHETNVKGLYLAGVVCGGMKTNKFFIENSKDHADKIIAHILNKEASIA